MKRGKRSRSGWKMVALLVFALADFLWGRWWGKSEVLNALLPRLCEAKGIMMKSHGQLVCDRALLERANETIVRQMGLLTRQQDMLNRLNAELRGYRILWGAQFGPGTLPVHP